MILFYILIFAAPMPNHPIFEASVAGITTVKWLGLLCCGYALGSLQQQRRVPGFLSSWEVRGFLVLFAIAAVSYATLTKPETITFRPMSSYVSFMLLFFVAMCVINTSERLHNTLLAAIAGCAVTALYVVREFQASGGTNLRPGYIAGDCNYFASSALLVIPVALYLARGKSSPAERWFCIGSLAVILIAFTLASSRGGLVGLGVEIAYLALRSRKARRIAVVTGLVSLPLLVFSPASPLARMLHPTYGDDLGAQIRRDFWRAGFEMIENHPFTGVGLGNFTAYSSTVASGAEGKHGMACNTLLEVTAELGFPGLLAYCLVVVAALRSTAKLRREGQRRKDALLFYAGESMQAGLLGFLTAGMFVSTEYQKPFWVFLAIAATVPTFLKRRSADQSRVHERSAVAAIQSYASTRA